MNVTSTKGSVSGIEVVRPLAILISHSDLLDKRAFNITLPKKHSTTQHASRSVWRASISYLHCMDLDRFAL